jgi:hypothetical protein
MLSAFEDAGGRKWLASLGTSHPQVLAILVGKLLPQSLANDPENPLTATPSIEEHQARARELIREAFAPHVSPETRPAEETSWPSKLIQ